MGQERGEAGKLVQWKKSGMDAQGVEGRAITPIKSHNPLPNLWA